MWFHNGEAWITKLIKGADDVPVQGSFDGAEASELMALHILNKINEIVHIHSQGLYRDDMQMLVPARRVKYRIRTQLFKTFQEPRI